MAEASSVVAPQPRAAGRGGRPARRRHRGSGRCCRRPGGRRSSGGAWRPGRGGARRARAGRAISAVSSATSTWSITSAHRLTGISLAEPLGVVVPVGDEERLVGAQVEPVEPDRGHVGDHRVAVGHHGEDVAVGDRHSARPRGRVGPQRRPSPGCPGARPGRRVSAGDHLRVRLVDEPHVGDGQDGSHDVAADRVDGGVVVVVGVALPGGRVEHGATCARRQQRGRVQVELRPADAHQTVESNSSSPAACRCTAASPATKTRS